MSMYPTPTTKDAIGSRRKGYETATTHGGETLTDACRILLGEKTGRDGNGHGVMVLPHPEFAGWLMRLPGNWSKLKSLPSETDKMSSLLASPGESLEVHK
jgi:hypothetical protein